MHFEDRKFLKNYLSKRKSYTQTDVAQESHELNNEGMNKTQ